MMKKLGLIYACAIIPFIIKSQCENNLIMNGNFEESIVGRDMVGKYWIKVAGSPDIDNTLDSLSNLNSPWSDDLIPSMNGGNWQNIAIVVDPDGIGPTSYERFGQELRFNKSVPHTLEFEFAAQTVLGGRPTTGFAAVDVFLDEELLYTTEVDTTLFTWEKVKLTFIPKKKIQIISFAVNPELNLEFYAIKYIAIDGVCVRPIQMGLFCDN